MPAASVGLSSFLECVAISYERSGHTQPYRDCPMERLTFPIVRAESPTSESCAFPPPAAPVGSGAVAGGCKHRFPRDEVLGVEWTIVAC